jgi:hypothetical protein
VAKQDAQQSKKSTDDRGQIGDVLELVKDYARQETVGPLRGAARWLGYGIAGAIMLGFGSILLVLGLLRLVQNEWGSTFDGRWTGLLPHLFALLLSVAIIGLAISRIAKSSLHPKSDR